MPNVVQATKTQPSSYSFAKIFYPITNRNRNLFLPAQIQPSPVEMEHVSTSLDIAKTVNLREPGQPCLTLGHRGPGPTAKLMIQKVKPGERPLPLLDVDPNVFHFRLIRTNVEVLLPPSFREKPTTTHPSAPNLFNSASAAGRLLRITVLYSQCPV